MDEDFRCKGMYRERLCRRLLFIGYSLKMTGILSIRCPRCGCDNNAIDGKLELSKNDDSNIEKDCYNKGN